MGVGGESFVNLRGWNRSSGVGGGGMGHTVGWGEGWGEIDDFHRGKPRKLPKNSRFSLITKGSVFKFLLTLQLFSQRWLRILDPEGF